MSALAAVDGVVVLILLLAAAVVFFQVALVAARRDTLHQVARRFRAEVTAGWLSDSDLEMDVDGFRARLVSRPAARQRAAFTRLRIDAPSAGRLRIVPEGAWEGLKKAFWSGDLLLGDPDFDAAYVVQGWPVEWVRRVLDAPSRRRLRRLADLGSSGFRDPSVTFEAGLSGILIAVPRCLVADRAALESFISESIELFRALRRPPEDGVLILSVEEAVAEGNCPVCEHPLGPDPRACDACATPHHFDCWAYFGGCSTYACTRRGGV